MRNVILFLILRDIVAVDILWSFYTILEMYVNAYEKFCDFKWFIPLLSFVGYWIFYKAGQFRILSGL